MTIILVSGGAGYQCGGRKIHSPMRGAKGSQCFPWSLNYRVTRDIWGMKGERELGGL